MYVIVPKKYQDFLSSGSFVAVPRNWLDIIFFQVIQKYITENFGTQVKQVRSENLCSDSNFYFRRISLPAIPPWFSFDKFESLFINHKNQIIIEFTFSFSDCRVVKWQKMMGVLNGDWDKSFGGWLKESWRLRGPQMYFGWLKYIFSVRPGICLRVTQFGGDWRSGGPPLRQSLMGWINVSPTDLYTIPRPSNRFFSAWGEVGN
jgi:hypothetical protein